MGGIGKRRSARLMPFIFNLTASTVMSHHAQKMVISSVESALKSGADCVACHINFSSYETEIIRDFAMIPQECDNVSQISWATFLRIS